ncbi:MAG TPA: PEP-CTERM sorting domain-containing protein [Stellaceae bacterium]|jgi:hypothetical protein
MRTNRRRVGRIANQGAAAFAAAALVGAAAQASVISPTPTLPPANGIYVGTTAPGCFPAVNLCVGTGSFAITSVISSTFSPSGQDLVLGGVYTSALTDLSHNPIGTVSLTGTIDEDIAGRTGPNDTGTWSTGLDALDLSGSAFGVPLSVGLDPSNPTNGTTSITPVGSEFLISSFFDVFAEITAMTPGGPLTVDRGPLHVELVPTPEPATLALLALPFAGLLWWRRRAQPTAGCI